ncbi:MAG: hypothetical protein QOD98_3823, partial [Nocardioidaceae bacterium]|nr:hypothetical protein [Nocardioidaceae bacterium]
MRPRLALLLGALLAPALPLLTAAPAQAALGTICVGPVPAGTVCNTTRTTIPLAIADATSGDVIRVGPGTYNDGPYALASGITLQGSGATGAGATVITLPANAAAQPYVTGNNATIRNLRVVMEGASSGSDQGIDVSNGSTVISVVVIGSGSIANATGLHARSSTVDDATVNLTQGPSNRAVFGEGGNTFTNSTWNGSTGYVLSSPTGGLDVLSRVTIRGMTGNGPGAWVDAGTIVIDDALINLGTSTGAGLRAANPSSAAFSRTVIANHLTIVGGGTGSVGVLADATLPTAQQTSTATLTNSIVYGPDTSIRAVADNNGSPAANSVATITTTYTDYEDSEAPAAAHGTATTTFGDGNLKVNPQFLDPANANFALRGGSPASPVIDKGQPGTTPPTVDLNGDSHFVDGDGNGTKVRDMGAFELAAAPKTSIATGPSGLTSDNTPVFTFKSDTGKTFECQLDGGGFQACSSPVTTTPLPDGPHRFTVRAIDAAFTVEVSPPARSFTVDTVAPDARFTKKPPKRFFKQRVKFKFVSNEAGAKFQCQLDNLPWR